MRLIRIWLICAAAALLGAAPASARPDASFGDMQEPASAGVLDVTIFATEEQPGVALTFAVALLDGEVVDEVELEEGTCVEIACPVAVRLLVPTADEADGVHALMVLVENENGEVFELSREFEVDNTPPVSSPMVVVNVGSAGTAPSPPVGGEETPPAPDPPTCVAPRLSMFLAQTPLRYRRDVPVLAAGRRYRFLGELTCLIDGRRRTPPRGTEVEFRIRIDDRTVEQEPLEVRKDRRLLLKIAFSPGSRVLIFRVRGTDGEVLSVRIPIRVVAVDRGRR